MYCCGNCSVNNQNCELGGVWQGCVLWLLMFLFLELAFKPALILVQRFFYRQCKKVKVVSAVFNSVEPIIFVVSMLFMFRQTDFWSWTCEKAFDWPVLVPFSRSDESRTFIGDLVLSQHLKNYTNSWFISHWQNSCPPTLLYPCVQEAKSADFTKFLFIFPCFFLNTAILTEVRNLLIW